ncbi:1-deoxy-D-xylulose-5-phosphate reductoisomerase [Candidatus Pelagibacter sp. HIMB1495]|uniref:1-deoxy-D-xylulose-5-phosphate reductoisomerase n=1 Tax=unclassified Candidatus Pelagibacter TaxID=2647897 RepID=UPI003F8686EB
MKLKIAILGSTGSIGKSLLKIISKDKEYFKIFLLTADRNYKLVLSQAKKFDVRNIIITNKKYFKLAKVKNKNKRINIYNNFNNLENIFKKKIDYVMSAIVGLDGLDPTYRIIPHTNKIAIANKETIICAWHLIKKKLKKYNTEFVPVDSEHFSIWYSLKNNSKENIEKLYLTASGGPLLKIPLIKFEKLKISKIIHHPNWKMGEKISVDSATMMNKVFEIIEAKKIFDLNYKQISIMVHPSSYVHAIIKYKDGMINLIAHETTMEIPILNSLPYSNKNKFKTKKIEFNKLNNMELSNVDKNKFPFTRLLSMIPKKDSLFETVLVSVNDYFVGLFLNKKISYLELIQNIFKSVNKRQFVKYKFLEADKITDIFNLNKEVITILKNNKYY